MVAIERAIEMVEVEVSEVIKRPAEEIYELISIPENGPKRQSGVLEAEQTSKGPRGVGATKRELRFILGRQTDQTFEVSEYEPIRIIRLKSITGAMPLETSYAFESVEGDTRLTLGGRGETSGFFMFADPLIPRMAERQMEVDVANFKDMQEAQD